MYDDETFKMNEKKVRPNNVEQQSNVNKNKINKSTEIFVLSPLFLQNLGISIKDITHEEETSCAGTNKDGANIQNEQRRNYINNTSVSKKVQYNETSIVETANSIKESVFMSSTFIPSDNNDSLVENVKPKEFDTAKNINANEELILNRNVSEDTIGVQIETLGDVNKNDVCQKNIHDTQSLTEYASVAIVIDDPIPIANTGPNDYASNYSTTNEQDSREMLVSNDASSPCGYYIHKSNSGTQDTDIVFSSTNIEEVHLLTNSSCYQEAINNECHQVISDEVGKKSNKENDSFQNQISYSDKTECADSLNLNKQPELISDNLIELNDLIVVNNTIKSNMSENGNTSKCEISNIIATDLMDFDGVDNVSLQIIENEKNNHFYLGKVNNKVFSEEQQFGHLNKDSCNENQNYVSVHCLYSRNKNDVDKDIEGAQCDHSSNNTKVDLFLKSHQNDKQEQSLHSSVDVNTEFCQFTTPYQNQCSKEVDVPSTLAELNRRHFMDNSKDVAFVHSQVKNIENGNLRSTGTVDHTEENELKDYSSPSSRLKETVGENAENDLVIQETGNLPNSSTLNSCDNNSVNDNIIKTEINTTNLDYNAPLLRDKDGIFGVSKTSDIKIKKQQRSKKSVLCGKLKEVTIKKSHCHESENSSSAASSTHQNQCYFTENEPEKCETNVNLIATYLKQITQMHTQGPKPKSYKTSKKMVSKLSVQGVEKPGGSKLIQKQENRFHFNTSNLSIKKTYHRKHVLNKRTVVNPIANKIYNESPCQSYSLDYIEKPVSTDIKMGFCICVDYGHIFYDTSYTDLEHLHYPIKVSGDFNSHDFVTDHSIIDFNCNKSFSDETSKVSKDVTETPDPQTSSICWKNTEELIEQNKFNEALGSDDVLMSSEKFIETKVGSLNILNNVPGETVNILKMADSETLSQQSCCLDPKVHRTGLNFGANAFLSVVEKESVQSSNSVYEKDPFGCEFNLTDAVHIQQERMESDDSLMLLNSELIDSSMDGKMQSTDTPDITLPVTVSSNQSPYHFMNINDGHDNKMLRMAVDDSDQNDMNTNSDQKFESQCPEFLSCDICNLNVKTEEWINHKCLSNSLQFEENGNISEIFEATDIVPKCLKKLLKKTEFLKCRRCGKNIKCAELYLMHVNKCSGFEKVSAIIYEDCDEKQNSKGSVRKEKPAIAPHVTEEVFECTCGVCYQVIDINSWISHIQKEHDYLAWQKDETPIDFSTIKRIKEHLVKISKTFGLLICKHCGLKQKRYRRSYEKYIEVYLDHVELCGNPLSQVSNVAKKIQNLSSNQDDVVTEDTNNRLSVNTSRLSEFDEKDFEIEQNFVCGVCAQTVVNIEWTHHIQTQHNYLAWKKGDAEINFNSSSSIKEHLINVSKTSGLLICKHCGLKQKRYKRSYDRYIDIYLEHVELCAHRVLSDATEKAQEISGGQNSDNNAESNNSLTVNDSTMSVIDAENGDMKEKIICGVCEQAVDNTEWLKHTQLQHNYFAWKKGDPELLSQVSNVAKKIQNLSSNQDDIVTEDTNNRLSVNASRLSEFNEKDFEIEQSFVCGVCEQTVENIEWTNHIQIQHNYLAWKKGDTEINFNSSSSIKEHLINVSKTSGLLICKHCGLKQKRNKRSFDRYIDIYLEHVELCARRLLSDATEKTQEIQNSDNNAESNSSLTVNDSTMSVIDAENGDMKENIVCGVCEQAVDNKEWLKHIQLQHNYFAWKKGDPELDLKDTYELQEYLVNLCSNIRYLFCNKCGLKINRYLRTDKRYVLCFMEHIVKCNPDVKNVSQDSCMNNDSRMNCDNTENSFVVKNRSEETSISNISENIPSITCGVCHEVVEEKLWIEHTKIQHNYIAWPQGVASLDLNNSEEIESFLVELTKKIGSLSCSKCDVKLKRYKRTYENYIKSFLKHVEKCNYNAVPKEKNETLVVTGVVSCAICSHEMNQDEWNNHLLHKHYNLAWRIGLDEPLDLQDTADIVRQLKEYNKNRKMTCNNCGISRASIVGFFAHIVTCNKTEEEIAPFQFKCEICGASSLRVYYQQHMAGHKLQEFNEEKKKLKLEAALKEEQITETVPSGKRKAAHKAMAVLEKYTTCKYKCDECEFKTDCEQELIGHRCDVGGSCVDSEDSAGLSLQSSNESSDEIDENLSDEENQTINKKKRYRSSGHKYFTLPFNVKNVDAYLKDGCNKFMKAHYTSDTLFDEWLHCPYSEVSSDEVQWYLPPLAESCKIKFDGHWDTYKLFEARECKGYSLFMGGCISCMAWVPGPTNALQMLAVATYHSNDIPRFSYDTIHEHPGLIQIWSCGSLGNKLPEFSLGIAHDFGTVWAMEWCPSGAQTPLPEDSSCTTRLGLLAVACSNGLVYIFTVPHPSTMPSKYCKLQPVAELRFWTSSEHSNHQATAINWSKQKGHSVIAVGYSDGITAMFDLKIDSPILKHKEGNTTIFYPYSDDYSFNSSITGISIYPTMEAENTGLEVIGCSSTTGAMLQVKTAGGPAHVVRSKTAINGAEFMLHWPALFISMDDITPTKPLSELEVWGLGRRAGGARVIATCACCPRLFSWSPPLVRTARVHPLYDDTKKRPVAVIEMVPFKGEDQKPKKQKVDDDLSFKVEPTVYDDAVLKYGVRFQFINPEKRQRIGTKPSRIARPDLYPLADVRAFAVCPSPVRHNWLAIGLHAGFVFIIRT